MIGPRCLYCLALDGEPSVEHVVPAALGELATLTLPSGAVCRSCNNWTGIAIDEPFTQLFAVRFIRGIYRIPDERGKRVKALELAPGTRVEFPAEGPWLIKMISPQAEANGDFFAYDLLQNGPYRRLPDGSALAGPAAYAVVLLPKDEADEEGRRPPGSMSIPMDLRRKRTPSQDRRAARALMKMGLGLVYAKEGANQAMHPRYDLTRAAILGQPYEGWFLTRPFGRHEDKLDLTVEITGAIPGIDEAVVIKYGQFHMVTGMRPGVFPEAASQWCVDHGWEVHPIASVREGKPREPYIRLGRNWKQMVDAKPSPAALPE